MSVTNGFMGYTVGHEEGEIGWQMWRESSISRVASGASNDISKQEPAVYHKENTPSKSPESLISSIIVAITSSAPVSPSQTQDEIGWITSGVLIVTLSISGLDPRFYLVSHRVECGVSFNILHVQPMGKISFTLGETCLSFITIPSFGSFTSQ